MTLRVVILLALLLYSGPTAFAQMPDRPDGGLLFNSFSSFRTTDSVALATTDYGLLSLRYDQILGRYLEIDHLFLNTQPFTLKVRDGIAAVRTWANIIYFVNISDPSSLVLLGEADLGYDFYDYEFHGQSLFVATGYDGLWQYDLSAYADPVFADSSMRGIHCVQCTIVGDNLLVLDDYNGLLRYNLAAGMDQAPNMMYLPRRAESFVPVDSLIAFTLWDQKLLYFGVNSDASFALTDSLELLGFPQALCRVDSFLVTLNQEMHSLELINWRDKSNLHTVMPEIMEGEFDGDGRSDGVGNYLIVPTCQGGLASFHLDNLWVQPGASEAYARPGPVNDITFFQGQLVSGGGNNPLEFYNIDSTGGITFDTAFYGLNNVGAISHSDSLLFVLYPDLDAVYSLRVTEDSLTVLGQVEVAGSSVWSLRYLWDDPIDTLEGLLALRLGAVEIYSVDATGDLHYASSATASGRILDAVVADSFLVFTTNKFQLHTYKIFSDFRLIHWYSVSTTESIRRLHVTGAVDADNNPLLIGFAASGQTFRITIPKMFPPGLTAGPEFLVDVTTSLLVNDTLFTIGEVGLGVMNLSGYFPSLIDQGGFAGHLLARQDWLLAASNGTAILTYLLEAAPPSLEPDSLASKTSGLVLRNYPNPFNPRTEIEYSVDREGPVTVIVYNMLGQVVTTLYSGHRTPGLYRIEWEGTDDSGTPVATGAYLYRLSTASGSETRKMMLIK